MPDTRLAPLWLAVSALAAGAQPRTIHCRGLEVRAAEVVATAGVGPENPAVKLETLASSSGVTLRATGPILGSMDFREVETSLACTPEGVEWTAFVKRTAEFIGAVQKNILWRPRVDLVVTGQRGGEVVKTTWKIRTTAGIELERAGTPPFGEQELPLSIALVLKSP